MLDLTLVLQLCSLILPFRDPNSNVLVLKIPCFPFQISFDHGAQRMTGTSPMTKRRMSVLQMKLLMQEKNLASLKRTSKHYVKQKDFMKLPVTVNIPRT